MDQEKVASKLKGNTLRVYWYLLQSPKGSVGPREVQRKLDFSSPALAVYHLEKLADLGLIRKVSGEYHLTKIVDVGVLKQFMKFRGLMVPRHVLYATIFTILFIFYLYQFREVNFYSIFAFIFGVLGNIFLWYETVMIWRSKP